MTAWGQAGRPISDLPAAAEPIALDGMLPIQVWEAGAWATQRASVLGIARAADAMATRRGPEGPVGPQGPRGFEGPQGTPGNYLGIALIGTGTSLDQRPASASEGQAWGLLEAGTLRLYVWSLGAWYDAGLISMPWTRPVAHTIYVQEHGNNANSGRTWGEAVRSIERALELAWAAAEPVLIEWGAERGVITQGHLDVPDECVIRSAHRTVTITPAVGYEQRNVFRLGSGCFVEGLLFEGWVLDSLADPSEGFAFAFRPGAVLRRAPYAHKCAVRTPRTWSLVAPPLDRANGNPLVGVGGGVVIADGLVCSQYSPFPNFMTWGATPVSHNGIGYCAKRGGLINAVNAVSMWAHRHFYALDGGQIILSACSTQFGDWSLHAKGHRLLVDPQRSAVAVGPFVSSAVAIEGASAAIVDDMWAFLVAGGYTAAWTAEDETFTRADGALFLRCIRWTLEAGDETPMLDFARGLFNAVGDPVFSSDKLAAFTASFSRMRDQINAVSGVVSGAQALVTALVAALNATLTAPVRRREPSRITAIGHTWTAVMAGVALAKIPPANNRAAIRDSILEEDEGVVIASGQDDVGNAIFVGGLEISAETGELGGPPFDTAVRRQAIKASIAGSF